MCQRVVLYCMSMHVYKCLYTNTYLSVNVYICVKVLSLSTSLFSDAINIDTVCYYVVLIKTLIFEDV